jgi:hypothetical protein
MPSRIWLHIKVERSHFLPDTKIAHSPRWRQRKGETNLLEAKCVKRIYLKIKIELHFTSHVVCVATKSSLPGGQRPIVRSISQCVASI